MLPAGQTAYAAIRALVDRKADPITFSPKHSFCKSGFELTVTAQNAAFTADKEKRTVDSAIRPGIEFDKANCHINACSPGGLTQAIGGGAGDFHSVGQVSDHGLIPEWRAHWIAVEEWIAWQPGLGKSRKGDPLLPCLLNKLAGLLCRSLPIKIDRCRLDGGQRKFGKKCS